MESCGVCCETFNKTTHKKVECPFCDLLSCRTCCQTYLVSTPEDPHCMGCKNIWNREFIDSFCTKKFRNTDLRIHRENVLFEREKIRMPETQPEVERILAMRELNFILTEQRERLVKLHNRYSREGISIEDRKGMRELRDLNAEMTQTFEDLNRLRNGGVVYGENSNVLVRKCPLEDCKGFLNEDWFCGLCKNNFCEHCNENIEEGHVCDPDAVKTMKLLKKDTKSCPKCGTMIYKIDGCSQMWCPDCHTAFDWRSGKIEVGRIHNPHYIEFKNKFSLSREHGDIPCGGVPDFGELHLNKFMTSVRRVISQYNRDIHFRYDEIHDTDNRWLRIVYMLNDMTEDIFKRELQRRDKQREKHRDIRNLFQMFVDTAGDLLRQFVLDRKKYHEIRDLLIKLAGYVNTEIGKIHKRYNCVVPYKLSIE
jgi:hypothetical protein